MRITLAVDTETGDRAGATDDLYDWLRQDPGLRSLVRRESPVGVPAGAMGAWSEVLTLVLAPGGPTAAVGAAVVVWLQNRRGNQTVTINQPDGTQVVVSSEKVRGLTAEGASELAQQVAEALRQRPATDGTEDRAGQGD
ncbi:MULTISPECIES: effector-associated constant component EACC1 [unclassified Streptomyces]|uniref:effector-associated constant component EACC1 n=1 Tax=unclassified Streptomyces TaxID=2593676 RepID=UPI00101E42E9|nr:MULTISPECIES: hypothetical protein [unclassified Streptomyces]MBZ9645199.1 hypothetical protein [Streptomyces sp. PSKA30]RZB13438.1 hypothetical protein StrepF001_44165 [Streptomyces sp. F001]